MKFTKKNLKDHQVQLKVEFDAKEFNQYQYKAAKKISSKSKVPGFRPGKAPLDVVQRIYGSEFVDEEALELLIHDKYPELLDEAQIKPAAAGTLEKIESTNPPKLTFKVPLEPSVKLGNYKDIRKTYELPEVNKTDIDEVIHNLQINYAESEIVDRQAKEGDLVNFRLSVEILNPEEDEDKDLLKNSPYQMIIGEDQKEEFPFNGFDKELLNLKAEDKKTLKHKYPKNSSLEKLQGKEIRLDIEMTNVKELKLPEINEEFAKKVSGLDSVEKFTDSVKQRLQYTKNQQYEENYYSEIIEEIVEKSEIAYPPQLLEREKDVVLQDFERNLAKQNLDLDIFLKLNKTEKDDFIKKEIEPAAKNQLEQSLVMDQLSQDEKMELGEEELQQVYTQTMYEVQMRNDFKKLKRELSPKKLANSVLMQAASRLMNRQILRRLKQIANEEEDKDKVKEESKKEINKEEKNKENTKKKSSGENNEE